MHVPFADLKAQYKTIKKPIDAAIRRVMDAGIFAGGEEVEMFEKEFGKYIGAGHCISLNSGTDALILGMRALDLPPNSEVLVPANTFIATALAASENGLKPVFVDIDEEDNGLNLADLKKKINSRTKAIMIVHLYGQAEKIDDIQKIIRTSGKKIHLIEDAAQAHGSLYKGTKVGNFGTFTIFSFYPTKNLGAYGDGGALITDDAKLALMYRKLKQYGERKRYYHDTPGINSRMDTLQAAILRTKLKYLNQWNKKRQELATYYTKSFNEKVPSIITPKVFADRKSIYHLYVVRAKKRDQLIEYLKKNDIAALIHYPLPLHLQKTFAPLGYVKGDLPIAEKVASEIVSLPMYPEMGQQRIDRVVSVIARFYS